MASKLSPWISAVRWWQWLAVSLLVGLLLGGARILWETRASEPVASMLGQKQFETLLNGPMEKRPSAITIYPPHDGFHFVTAREADGRNIIYAAAVAYRPMAPATLAGKTFTFPAYLDRLAVGHRYVWSDDWRVRLGTWTAASVGGIGIGWPVLLAVLIRLGLAPPRPVREPAYDLDRFKSDESRPQAGARQVSAEEVERLRVLEAEMERNLASGMVMTPGTTSQPAAASGTNPSAGDPSQSASAAPTPGALTPNARFSASQQEEIPPAADKPADDKSYGGTFYPTVAHAPRKPTPEE